MAKFEVLNFQEGSGYLFWSLLCVFVIYRRKEEGKSNGSLPYHVPS